MSGINPEVRNPLRIVFFGSPQFAVPTLRELLNSAGFEIAAAVTQPDRPAGRGRRLRAPAVKIEAQRAGIAVMQPLSIRKRELRERLRELQADYFAVVAYGKILSPRMLAIPRLGCVNLHASLLPRYRGAAPVNWALIRGENVTGVTAMLMDEGMDTGPILLQQRVEIGENETAMELAARLAEIGAPLLASTLRQYAAGEIAPLPQDENEASAAPLLKKTDGEVDWRRDATEIVNLWRGLQPWPGVYSSFRGQQIKLARVAAVSAAIPAPLPGTLAPDEERILVSCGRETWIELLEVQLPGKRPIDARDFARGYRLQPDEQLGEPD